MEISLLSSISSPEDLKNIPQAELSALCKEIRETIIDTVSKNGGHLASNLGCVELTVALHRSFSSPSDNFIFDVSHQTYTHKLLTGRYSRFHTLRKKAAFPASPIPMKASTIFLKPVTAATLSRLPWASLRRSAFRTIQAIRLQ